MTRHVKFFTAIGIFAVHLRHILQFLLFTVRNRVLGRLEVRISRGRETTDFAAGGKKKMAKTRKFREIQEIREIQEFQEIQEIREIQEIQEIGEIPGFAGGIHRKKIDIV